MLALAGALAGALTVWTATPGPIAAVALARTGRPGSAIPPTMQPISIVGYGTAFAFSGPSLAGAAGAGMLAGLSIATLLGTAAGFLLRPRIRPNRVVAAIRLIAAIAAALLIAAVIAKAGLGR